MVGVIKAKIGLFDEKGKRIDIDWRKAEERVTKPVRLRVIEMEQPGVFRDSRGERRFEKGDFFVENEAGCRFVTTRLYVMTAYKKPRGRKG